MVVFHRRLPQFEYLAPGTLEEALKFINSHPNQCKVIAGGTDLIPKIKTRKIKVPEFVIDLKKIGGLDYLRFDETDGLFIGALTTVSQIEKSQAVKNKYPLLYEAAASLASVQVRNRGTMAGNICNAVPSADTAPALLVLDARLKLVTLNESRTVNVDGFFSGPNLTVAAPDEIMTEIHIPIPPPEARGTYIKLSPRMAMDLAVVGVAALAVVESGIFKDVKIALGAVAPTPVRARQAEILLRGQRVSQEIIQKSAEAAAAESRPIDDHRASAEYRRDMVKVLTARALTQTCGLK
jgi:aerobic carbon-monoxide dehydrogenase medium subunit